MNHLPPTKQTDSIAIIGLSGRFPGAKNIDEFWQNLKNGVESISFFSDLELLEAGIDPAILADPSYVKAKGVLENVADFDAAFFGFSPTEAEITDPQQRLFLECAWEALENAGYNPKTYSGAIGVYGGVGGHHTYFLQNLYANAELRETLGDYPLLIGNDKDFLCTRLSYKLNLSGPSVTVQTACSSSLVAVVMGCQSLLDYQCNMALAGGTAISLPIKSGYVYKEGMILSPDGHCRAFDAKAQGTVGGNGVGIVVLKRVADALRDGDHIYAIIRGAAINNDGALKVGYTAPSVEAQARVIAEALGLAEVSVETISYVETHGTGTPLGDPVEMAALTKAFRDRTDKTGYCAIGSVKTNVGHLDAAAGVTGLIKTVLALHHQLIPPSLHFETPNPKLNLAQSPFYVNTKLADWKTSHLPRRAGVSSFGVGGTNAHVILQEAPRTAENQTATSQRPWQLLPLSARTTTALEAVTTRLLEHVNQHPHLNLADVAYTYQVGRNVFSQRRMLVCQTLAEVVKILSTPDSQRLLTPATVIDEPHIVFMFSGQGAQYVNMGRELYQTEPTFREKVDYCAEFLKPHLGMDLRAVLYQGEVMITSVPNLAGLRDLRGLSLPQGELEGLNQEDLLKQTFLTQPALFVIEYALAHLWMSWGIQPKAMIGHSIGEYVAACLAGVFTLEEALVLVTTRGRLMQSIPSGTMLAVPLAEEELRSLLPPNIDIATINIPSQTVVSGPTEVIAQWATQLATQGLECQPLHTSHAFHSDMMSPILPAFLKEVQKIQLQPPKIPYLSNFTGTWITSAQATDPHYWVKHLRHTVRFAAGLQQIFTNNPKTMLLEVGPGRTLSTFAKRHPNKSPQQVILSSLRHPKDEHSDSAFLLTTLGQLWLAGVTINWSAFHAHEQRHRLPLPTYPFERQRYWVTASSGTVKQATHRLSKNPDLADWFYAPTWKRTPPPLNHTTPTSLRWLVFLDDGGVGAKWVERLTLEQQEVVTVRIGNQFAKLGQRDYTLNPSQGSDYDALFAELLAQNQFPNHLVHFWTVTATSLTDAGLHIFDQAQTMGFYSLLFLAQTFGKQNLTEKLQLSVISNGLQDVTGEERLDPLKATVLGAVKVIPQEYPNVSCCSIDIVLPEPHSDQAQRLIEQLWLELTQTSTASVSILAYRGQYRWLPTLEPMKLQPAMTSRLRKHGVYLITGGLGGMGLVFAEYLAKTVQAKLILLSRTQLPERAEWASWLATHDDQDSLSLKIRKIQEMERLGAEVWAYSADVANYEQMQDVITQTTRRFGTLQGVIHTAGVADYLGIIQSRTREMTDSILVPKVKGTLILDSLLKDMKLDFFVLCSSLGTILYQLEFGEVGYCAANDFLDVFAGYKTGRTSTREGTFTVAINWNEWQAVGMSVVAKKHRGAKTYARSESEGHTTIPDSLSPSEGVEVFQRILANQVSRIAVSTQDLVKRSEQVNLFKAIVPQTATVAAHPRPQLSQTYVAPCNEIEHTLTKIWQTFLGVESVGTQDNFFDLGGDSLLAVQLIAKVRDTFQIELSPHSLLKTPSIATLAESIQQLQSLHHGDKLPGESTLPSSLVEIQKGKPGKRPLFLVHPVGGHVYIYRELVSYLDVEQPVYGIQATSLEEVSKPISIEEMATDYLKVIQVCQPTGPYCLGGSSFGGLVAFEMAQQLQTRGQTVALLAMIDTPHPSQVPTVLKEDVEILAYLLMVGDNQPATSLEQIRQLIPDKQMQFFLERGKIANKILPQLSPNQLRAFLHLFKTNVDMMLQYVPRPYSGRIIFFRAQEQDAFNPPHPERHWLDLVAGGVELYEIPGNHITINYSPQVEVIAKQLQKYLQLA